MTISDVGLLVTRRRPKNWNPLAARADIEPVRIRSGDRVAARGHWRTAISGEIILYPDGGAGVSSPSRGVRLRLSGLKGLDHTAIQVTGVWRDGVVEVELATRVDISRGALDLREGTAALREWVRKEASAPRTPLSDSAAARLLDQLQQHPDVVRVTGLSLSPGSRVLVVATQTPTQVAQLLGDSISEGHVVVVSSRWSKYQFDRARKALRNLPVGEVIRGGQGLTERGEPFLFAHTRRPMILHGMSADLVRIQPWIELVTRVDEA